MDWDDIEELDMIKLKNKGFIEFEDKENIIHKRLESGFISNTIVELENGNFKDIKSLKINDIVKKEIIVAIIFCTVCLRACVCAYVINGGICH